MRKPTICIGENKAADQLCSYCSTDQHLCFRCKDNTILLLLKSEISSFSPASVTVQLDLCQTWSEPKLLVLSRTGSNSYGNVRNVLSATDTVSEQVFPGSLPVQSVKSPFK